ncbi:MAG: lipopolysaccharide biosynthesis protein [Ancrocorticia sp.]|jgi:O-antigen/teichoic acid export membrane protein|nr:lipopolysaccharide biosynthesis protein [Ancrocorticia sp.]
MLKTQLSKDYFWNTASSIIGSISMVLMLIAVTRVNGVYAGGVFSLATAAGQQFQTLGAYEVRPYQSTDVRYRFTFGVYLSTRVITVTAMMACIAIYAALSGRPIQEALAIFLLAALRFFDAFEDAFYGEFQRIGRLDIAGKTNFFRVLTTMATFVMSIVATRSLIWSAAITFAISFIAMIALIMPPARTLFSLRPSIDLRPIGELLVTCLPLFLSAFLSMYLSNAPRYAIDNYLTTELQGYYGILFMPALAINVLAMFVFRPLLTRMANHWVKNEAALFRALFGRGMVGVVIASLLTFAVTWAIGIPLLNLLFSVHLDRFLNVLLILVTGGAFNAATVVLYYALATMRLQRAIFLDYLAVAILTFFFSRVLVSSFGLLGAAFTFVISMLLLSIAFALTLVYGLHHPHTDRL